MGDVVTYPLIPNVTNAPIRRPGDVGTLYRPQLTNPNPLPVAPFTGPTTPVTVVLSGPFFSTALPSTIAAMLEEMKFRVASQVLADVQYELDRSIRHPTPYYETQVMVQQRVDDWVVHDRGVSYGPWLEGTSSRNRTTRFKGYASFRRAFQSAGQKAPQIISAVARTFVDRMNR